MKICVVSPSYPTSKTIIFVFVDQLVRAFVEKGEEVTVIAPQSISRIIVHGEPISKIRSIIKTSEGSEFVLYRPFYFSFGNGRFSFMTSRSFNGAVCRTFKRFKTYPDVLYGHFWSSIAALLPLSMKYKIPLFGASGEENVKLYDSFNDNEKHRLRESLKGLINVSSKNQEECVALGLIPKDKTRVIPNAVNLNLFRGMDKKQCRHALGISDTDFVVGFMGQFIPRKGTLRLSRALDFLNDDSIKAIFIGSGIEDPSYKNIIYKGRLDHDSIPKYLSACDVFVLPTENEGCSNAIIEALACGLPVISTDANFNYDILDNSNSIMIDCQNVEQIALSIKKLKTDNVLRLSLAEGAFRKAGELSLDKRVEKILLYIKEKK